jgi:hypothetical protein
MQARRQHMTSVQEQREEQVRSKSPRHTRPQTKARAKKATHHPEKATLKKISAGGIILPPSADDSLVAPSKLRRGFKSAKLEIQAMLDEFVSMMGERYHVTEIELSAGFSADGKFLGFGVGGAASIKVKIRPADR